MQEKIDLLLINARSRSLLPGFLPYGLLWIAGVVRERAFKVRIWDRNVSPESLNSILRRYYPRIVGISCLTGPVINDAIMISKFIRKESKDIPIVWGGLHPTIFPRHVLEQEYVDYIIRGEGEYPALELMEHILKGKNRLENIANLGFKERGKIRLNREKDFIALDELPLPAWDLVDMPKYYQNKFYYDRVITLNTSRGCPFRCSFCYNQAVNKRKWRGMSARKIIQHIVYLKKRYNIKGFQIYDDDFDAHKKRLMEFCKLLIKEKVNISWQHFSRVNYAREDILRLEKKAGCRFVEYGVESGSQRILDFIQKDQTVSQIREAFSICQKVGIPTGALFMIGLPTETGKEVAETVSLINSLKAHQTIATVYKPYPATGLYDYCAAKGLFKLPEKLTDQGKIYALSDFEINVSKVPTDYLKQLHGRFAFANVLNEARLTIKHKNFRLLFFYIRNRLNPQGLTWFFRVMRAYLGIKVHPAQKGKR